MKFRQIAANLLIFISLFSLSPFPMMAQEVETVEIPDSAYIEKVLFIGDSMTGWLAMRLQAYGELNGFEVAAVYQDGATVQKWAGIDRLDKTLEEFDADLVVMSLGGNNLFETYPEKRLGEHVDRILEKIGDREYIWFGPIHWPYKKGGEIVVEWLKNRIGEDRYFDTFNLEIERQGKTNMHPTMKGSRILIDHFVDWLRLHPSFRFRSLETPAPDAMKKGPLFIYKRMKETL